MLKEEKPNIIFLGTPDFAVPFLDRLIESGYKPVLVVTQPDKPVGRTQAPTPPPVKRLAQKNNIPVFQPNDHKDLNKIFSDYQPELCVLVAFGMIVPEKYLHQVKYGWINVHPSLLPHYRGSSPIQAAVLNGDEKTGISIIELTDKLDAGPIYAQQEVEIKPADSSETLHDKLAEIGAELLVKILPDYIAGKIKPVAQDDAKATFTKKISRDDGRINWQDSADKIYRQFRAFHPWPGIFTYIDGKRLKITNLGVPGAILGQNQAAGKVFLGLKQELLVKTAKGIIELKKVQLEGKKEMTGKEFLNGHPEALGSIMS